MVFFKIIFLCGEQNEIYLEFIRWDIEREREREIVSFDEKKTPSSSNNNTKKTEYQAYTQRLNARSLFSRASQCMLVPIRERARYYYTI